MARPDKRRSALGMLERYRFSSNGQCTGPVLLNSDERYRRIGGILGRGRYGDVVPALDLCFSDRVAVKMMRRTGEPHVTKESYEREVRTLKKLLRLPPSSIARFCELRDHYFTDRYYCIVFEKYGDNLQNVLTDPRLSSLPVYQVKEISRQLLQAVQYLHDYGVVHANIAPANIMLVSSDTVSQRFYGLDSVFRERNVLKSTEIRIIDFGGVSEDAGLSGRAGTSGLRAPEMVIGWQWTKTVDHFALGCVIAAMLTCAPLLQCFAGGKLEEIAVLDQVLGPFTDDMVSRIRDDIPEAFDHRDSEKSTLSARFRQYLQTAKTVAQRIEDRDAARLIMHLTDLDPLKRELRARVLKSKRVFDAWRSRYIEPSHIHTFPLNDGVRQLEIVPWTQTIIILDDDGIALYNWAAQKSHAVSLSRDDGVFIFSVRLFWVPSIHGHVLAAHLGGRFRRYDTSNEILLFALDSDKLSTMLLTRVQLDSPVSAFDLSDGHLAVIGHTDARTYYIQDFNIGMCDTPVSVARGLPVCMVLEASIFECEFIRNIGPTTFPSG
ncbi:kinase-like domain-containing protein [Mycena vitilis]|nr:kinase-like domain-containing protein [Mycena vitilis]